MYSKAMNKYFSVVLLLLVNFLFSQKLNVHYKQWAQTDINDPSYIEEDDLILQIRNHSSIYYSQKYHFIMTNQQKAMEMGINPNKISNNYIIQKDGDKIFHIRPIERDFVKYQELEMPIWKLENEEKTIDSLKAKRAVCEYRGRAFTAWYTDSIPISDGPFKFKNLPGLVLEVESADGHYKIKLNGIEKEESELEFPKAITVKNRAEYLNELKQFADNPSYKMIQRDNANTFKYKTYVDGKEVNNSEKYKLFNKFVWDFMKIHNNPIEKDDLWIR